VRIHLVIHWVFIFLVGCSSSNYHVSSNRTNRPESLKSPYVLLVSIDGYRSDYTDLYSPPNLKQFREEGASAKGLLPVYPSKTFTNHYSIATGLYAENHGIVANTFYDPQRQEQYRLADRRTVEDGTWYSGEPLWVATEKQGMLAANFFWPGSEAEIQGIRPTYFVTFNNKISHDDRITQIRKWLELPEERRPHLLTLYFSDVDTAGHEFGPRSNEVKNAVLKVDQTLGLLLEELETTRLPVDVFIVSDHGMEELDPVKVEYLDDYTDLKSVRIEGDGPQVLMYTNNHSTLDTVYKDLKTKGKHFKIFKREELPAKYHYSKISRIGDLVVIADAPYSMGTHLTKFKVSKGNHGFDSDVTRSMQGIFYARGPHIKGKVVLEPFRNIHIYPLIMQILGLKLTTRIDGDLKTLIQLYQPRRNDE